MAFVTVVYDIPVPGRPNVVNLIGAEADAWLKAFRDVNGVEAANGVYPALGLTVRNLTREGDLLYVQGYEYVIERLFVSVHRDGVCNLRFAGRITDAPVNDGIRQTAYATAESMTALPLRLDTVVLHAGNFTIRVATDLLRSLQATTDYPRIIELCRLWGLGYSEPVCYAIWEESRKPVVVE